ncbi:MAG TPA: DNRLRE domain-containing protein [Thermoanaerobaculia bacterium]|nr:DNRLRE domain-containing protein [Thermoanaerobaculia bacterium]
MKHFKFLPLFKALALASLALLTPPASAEIFVPLAGGTAWSVEVSVANSSPAGTTVEVETLVSSGSSREATLDLAAGEAVAWAASGGEPFEVLALEAPDSVLITAMRRCASCGVAASVPVFDRNAAMKEGSIRLAGQSGTNRWVHGFVVVNPATSAVVVDVVLHGEWQGVRQTAIRIAGRAAGLFFLEDLFGTSDGDRVTFRAAQPVLLLGYEMNPRTGAGVFAPATPADSHTRRRAIVRPEPPPPSPPPPPEPQTVVLTPSKDNTLYESSNGAFSNGAGVHLFSGANNRQELRRALVAFDVASQIPPGSRITGASLTMHVTRSISLSEPMRLHRVAREWGEGASNAGSLQDGGGAPSAGGDATWIHTFFPDQFWSTPGGDFDAVPDATATASLGPVTWTTAEIVARVQQWVDQPTENFGWIIAGNEARFGTTKQFGSREASGATTRPALTVEFER